MKTRFTEVRNGIGLFTEIESEILNPESSESFVSDYCSWKSISSQYPGYKIGIGYSEWKSTVIEGMNFALNLIEPETKIEIRLLDINGHDCHSNLYSMFMAGFFAVFNELGVSISNEGKEEIKKIAKLSKDTAKLRSAMIHNAWVQDFKSKYIAKK